MKIELELDYKTVLRNSSRPVHLVAKLTAPASRSPSERAQPLSPWSWTAPVEWTAPRSNTQNELPAK